MPFSWQKQDKKIVALAPMANITTLPFRSICREFGADIVYTPMLSSDAIIHNPDKTLKIASFLPQEEPVIVQLFGYDGIMLAKAAKVAQNALKCAGIDINMGCPAPKITGNESGSALLKNLDKSVKMIDIIRNKFDGQLSVKLRLGWEQYEIHNFVINLEKLGVDAITVHGRTAKQGYRGTADWGIINEIASAVTIPVLGNGDINDYRTAIMRLDNGDVSGIMIGRAALGNPWIFSSIKAGKQAVVNPRDISNVIMIHLERAINFNGEKLGVREMRKHLCWYLKEFPGASDLRNEAVKVETRADIEKLLVFLEKKPIFT